MGQSPFPMMVARAVTISKNNDVRRFLAAEGDDGTAPRHVRHFIYPEFFPDRKRDKIAARLTELGFVVDLANGDHGLVVEEDREIASDDFDNLTAALEQMMKDDGWTYDGWECAVIRARSSADAAAEA